MNAYQTTQSSGIHWPDITPQPLYRAFQESPRSSDARRRPELFRELGKQMADYAAQQAVLDDVRKHYVLPADSSVLNFLTNHRGMAQVLLDAAPRLKHYFGAATIFSLRAPVDESGMRTLYAVVIWAGKIRDVRNALARFDDEWWLPHSTQASGYLIFTYELV